MKLIVLKSYNKSVHAHLAKAVLDGIGVESWVVGDHLENSGGPYFGDGLIDLKVGERDEEVSRLALEDNGLG